jgi:hypothetical protein
MRKIFILPINLLLVITITSCKKVSSGSTLNTNIVDSSSSTITATINDTSYSFNTQIIIEADSSINSTFLLIEGFNSDTTSNIILVLNSGARSHITDTVFNVNTGTNNGGFTYIPNLKMSPEYEGAADSNPASITVTSITDSIIQGTFQGNIYLKDSVSANVGDSTLSYKTVTNGKFNVKVHL